ncbi:iron chelate uptake ABC transporter family permease subunit, partial [Halomonas sp. BC04]|uniref:iron chelate uptake ABC transporter family permease subunit n=1 Tax=Halomonas sp. BC04 TaxID=1403540 RepID=UPI0005B84758
MLALQHSGLLPDRRLSRAMVGLLVMLALVCLASLLLGAGDVGPAQAWSVLMGRGDPEATFVLNSLRLPRTLVGLVVGVALGVAGA